jgi:hypothetical protein
LVPPPARYPTPHHLDHVAGLIATAEVGVIMTVAVGNGVDAHSLPAA